MSHTINWTSCNPLVKNRLPADVRDWLLDEGSLTARLVAASNGDFRVEVIHQGWGVPQPDEAKILAMQPREVGLIREVFLICHGEPWVFARSVIPNKSLSGPLRFLRQLKNQALGGLLFRDPALQRSHFDIARIHLPHPAIPVDAGPDVYGRRSLFYLKKRPLLVAEIFLPACRLGRE